MNIFKYQLQVKDIQTINLPTNYKILSLQVQHGLPCIWVAVDNEQSTIPITFRMIGTGGTINLDESSFLGTLQFLDGELVVHVFVDNF